MNKIKSMIEPVFYTIFFSIIITTYIFGIYSLTSDNNYSTKQFILGIAIPPYSIYVGGKELYMLYSNKITSEKSKKTYSLDELALYLNKSHSLPKKENDMILFKSISSEGNAIIYTYKTIAMGKTTYLKDALADIFEKAQHDYCEHKRYNYYNKMTNKEDVSMIMRFVNKDNSLIGEKSFSKNTCDL